MVVHELLLISLIDIHTEIRVLSHLGPWDDKTGIFAPLYRQTYQVESEALRNVVRCRKYIDFFLSFENVSTIHRMVWSNFG